LKNYLRGFLLSASQHGNKPPEHHEAKSLKRHRHYTPEAGIFTRTLPGFQAVIRDYFPLK